VVAAAAFTTPARGVDSYLVRAGRILRLETLVTKPHDQPGSPVRQLDAILADHSVDEAGWLSYGGSGSHTRLLCGGFELCPSLPDDLAEFLPPVFTLDADTGLVRWLEPLFALLKEETQASAPGAAAIFAKPADVFVSQALRSYLAAAGGLARLALPVLPDPDIARVVKMIRGRPEARWSVDACDNDLPGASVFASAKSLAGTPGFLARFPGGCLGRGAGSTMAG
jgi:Cupin